MKRISVYIFLLLIWNISLQAQDIPSPVNNTGIYDFLDELANNQVISVNSAVKPYSRMLISKLLKEAVGQRESLNSRQQKELDFYLMDFGKELENGSMVRWFDGVTVRRFDGSMVRMRRDLFCYKDSLFSLTVNPILGGELFTNSSGKATYWRNGAEARAYVGRWGFYASLRDNHEKPLLGFSEYLTKRIGGHLKGSTDWSEMKGGVTYSWNWGNAGLVKDDMEWGSNYNGANIFGGSNPSYIQLRLQLNPVSWFSFNWFHGWLNSMVVDSSLSYWVTNSYGTDYREVYHKKFISANMFTFTPFKYFNISVGNSIIYDNSAINPAFLVPLFFYKSVDHSVSSGIDNMNSQMFLDISSRQIRHLHLYATMFIDELSVNRITKDDEWNFFSYKAGFRISDLPVNNLSFTSEFTYTYPLTFAHYVPTLTFESNNYNLGHYLKDNSREWYLAFDYRPVRTLDIKIWFSDAIRGPDYTELGVSRLGNPPLDSINWRNTSFGIRGSYQIINDLYVWGSYVYSDISGDVRWGPGYFQGIKNTLNVGMTYGF
jgi:hypothetical protein